MREKNVAWNEKLRRGEGGVKKVWFIRHSDGGWEVGGGEAIQNFICNERDMEVGVEFDRKQWTSHNKGVIKENLVQWTRRWVDKFYPW